MAQRVFYEWDMEEVDGDEVIDHHHADKLIEIGILQDKTHRLVLVRTEDEGHRMWAYVDPQSHMLPKYFAVPTGSGNYHDTDVLVPQRFHREIARVAAGPRR